MRVVSGFLSAERYKKCIGFKKIKILSIQT